MGDKVTLKVSGVESIKQIKNQLSKHKMNNILFKSKYLRLMWRGKELQDT